MYEYIRGWLRVESHPPFQEENKQGMIVELKIKTTVKLFNFFQPPRI